VWHKSNSVAKSLIFSLTPRLQLTNLRSVVGALALVLVGCATPVGKSDAELVTERVQERWAAVIAGNYEKAYEYISPAGRSVTTLEGFKNSMKPGFHKSARILDVKCATPDVCEVQLEIEYEYQGKRSKSPLPERWVKQEGKWWFLLN
jgi:hypothetical protein